MKQMINMFWAMICAVALFIGAYPASASEDMVRLNIPCHITPKYKELFPEAQRFVDRINELGKGKVKANLYHSEKLLKVKRLSRRL